MALQPQRLNIPIAGGLTQDETPEYLDPPALYQCDNFYHKTRTSLVKRNGYDVQTPIVDSRNTSRDMTVPLLVGGFDAPIDRFIQTGSSCTFAARGYLWSYDELPYVGSTLNPQPNSIRHGEIPDLQIKQDTVVSIDGASASTSYIKECASAKSISNVQCTTYTVVQGSETYWRAKVTDGDTGNVMSDYLILSSARTLLHPCVASYSGGFVVTILDFEWTAIYAYRFDFQSMSWNVATWPSTVNFLGSDQIPGYYDMCGTGGNSVMVAACTPHAQYAVPGCPDIEYVTGGIIYYVVDAASGTIIHGPWYAGETNWNGTAGPWPVFSVAGTKDNHIGVVWSDDGTHAHKTHFISSTNDQIGSLQTITNVSSTKVGLGTIAPTNGIDALWNVMWTTISTSLTYQYEAGLNVETIYRYNTYSIVLASDQSQVGYARAYFSSKLVSNPFGVNGGSFALLAPDALYSVPVGWVDPAVAWNSGDIPWVLTRTWNDQWRGDPLEYATNYQFPHGSWNYGTVCQPQQPMRILADPSTTMRTASGALLQQDVFVWTSNQGNAVVNTAFDPTGPDRYDSSPIPGGGAIFGCASPWIFDGSSVFEAAFNTRPVLIDTQQSAGGKLHQDVADDSYHYFQIIYEHADERGRVTRSPVSQTYQIKIDADNGQIQLRVSNLFWNARKPNSVQVKVYLSQDAINYAFAGSGTCPTYEPTDTPDDVYVTITDYPHINAPAIYTSNGTLESGYPILAAQVCRWNNRVWLSNGNDIAYSQYFIEGDQVSFPDVYQESLDREVTALTPLDDRILLFSQDAVMSRSGEGPSESGQGSAFSNWIFLTHELGCINSRSVFHTPIGVFFQSRTHIELMDGNGNFIHQRAVEQYFSPQSQQGWGDTIVGVLSLPRDHQARFLYRERTTNQLKQLVLDYSTMTWSRWSGTGYVAWSGDSDKYVGDITVVGDQVYMGSRYGILWVEANGRQWDQSFSTDNTVPPTRYHIDWAVSSPWIKAEGLQGVQRVWRSTASFKTQQWNSNPYTNAPNPQMGIGVTINCDYSDISEVHPAKSLNELQVLRNATSGVTYLTIGHKYQQCRAYQIQLSGKDTNIWSYQVYPIGVSEILGLWTEFGIEPGTGRGRNEGKI